jgi:hypothetical protein
VPVTLAQAQLNTLTDLDFNVIDNFRRYSWLFDHMVFDDTVTPGTGGASLTYGYTQLITAAAASFRAFNTEYTPAQAVRSQKTVNLKPMGAAFNVDRTLANLGPAASNEVTFQMQQAMTSIKTKAQDAFINADTAVDANGFDGINKQLTGTSTEYFPNAGSSGTAGANYLKIDQATLAATTQLGGTPAASMSALEIIDDALSQIVPSHTGSGDQGAPGALPAGVKALCGNTKSILRMRSLARAAGMYTQVKDDLGNSVETYGDWVLVDLGNKPDDSAPIIPIQTRIPNTVDNGGAGVTGLTDLFGISFGLDSVHAAAAAGSPLFQSWLPDFSIAGAVKTGEIEMGPFALVLKNTKACVAIRNLKVQ